MTTMGEVPEFEFRCPECEIGFGKDSEAFERHVKEGHKEIWAQWVQEGTVQE